VSGKDRKKQLARQRYERQQARREAQERRARRTKIIGSVVAIVLVVGAGAGLAGVIGVGGDQPAEGDQANAGAQATPTPQPSVTVAPGECAYQPNAEQGAKNVGTPPKKPAHKGTVRATVKTGLGDIVMDLDAAKAPCTVNSMAYLASKNFFDKTSCHRLVTEGIKVLQCGDPTGTGAGGPTYRYANENTKGAKYLRGTVAMAHSMQPDSNGSQFFIVYGDSKDLPADYTVFGKIVKGMDVVDEVAKAGATDPDPTTGNTAPKKKIEIQDVTIAKN
jgi:peptidyl-prolyl cis-trans isomerase B (cyclophilin B)